MENRRPFLRPSPGEIEAAVKEQRERLRKFRIQQVREQSHKEAQRIRKRIEDERIKCKNEVCKAAVSKWQQDKENRLLQLQEEYEECIQSLGEAHGSAKNQPDPIAVLSEREQQNSLKAEKRNKEALKNEQQKQINDNHQSNFQINQRKKALHREKIRAKKVANLETPEAFKKKVCQIPKPPPTVKLHEAGTLTTTEYIPKNILIKKESGSQSVNARIIAAQEEDERKRKAASDAHKLEEANKRKELRGTEALRRERIHRQYEDLLARLDHTSKQHLSRYLRGTDLSVHETPGERITGREALEREMESAIERLMNEDTRDKRKHQESDSAYATDLIDSVENISSGLNNGNNDLTLLLKEIRRRREELLRESFLSKSSGGIESEKLSHSIDFSSTKTPPYKSAQELHKTNKREEHHERDKEKNSLPLDDYGTTRPQYGRTEPMSSSVHFKETVPVDYVPERVKERETREENKEEKVKDGEQYSRPERFGGENQNDSNFQHDRNIYTNNNFLSSPYADHNSNYDIDVEYSATAESTLKRKDSVNVNTGNVTDDIQASSSTEYLSPPCSLPSKNPLEDAISNLKRIQDQRIANQRLLDQQHQKVPSGPEVSSTPKPTYSQEINMEGSGKRPKKKKDKFQEQKSKLLEYYSKKLIDMKQEQLQEQISDSIDGSHVTITSMTPLIDNMKKTPKNSLASTSIYLSSSNSNSSCSSNYPDIDQIPTRLSKSSSYNLSSSKLPLSKSDTNIQIIYESSNNSSDTISINNSSVNNATPQQSISLESSPQESSLSIYSNNEISLKESSEHARKLEILKKLQELQRIKYELLKQQEMASTDFENEESSASSIDIDASASFQNTDKIAPVNTNVPQQRRVSFINPSKRELSTINEQETEFSDNVKYVDTSNSYHTPSKEFEETFSDSSETSHSTKQHLADMHLLLYDHHKYKSDKNYKDDMNTGKDISEPLSSSYDVNYSKQCPRDNLEEKVPKQSFTSNMETGESVTSNVPEPFAVPIADSSKESQCQTSMSTLNQSNTPSTKIGSEYRDEVSATEKSSIEKNSHRTLYLRGGYTPSAIVKSKLFTESSSHQKLGHSLRTVADDSLFTPLVAEDTLLPGFDEEKNILENLQDEQTAKPENPNIPYKSSGNSNSESESVVSMPDMADILQRFGMDWAKSMMRRMEKTEQNSSSDSSLNVK